LIEKHENASTDYDSGIGNVVLIVEISVDVHSARVKVGEKTRDLCWNIIVVYEGARRSSSFKNSKRPAKSMIAM